MTNKIIEAARKSGLDDELWIGPTTPKDCTDSFPLLARFYAIAYRQALEDAAKAVKSLTAEIRFQAIEHYKFADAAEKTILALKEQDAAIAAEKGKN